MNSYTLTSKKIKRNIFLTFILVIISFIFIDLCLYLYSDLKTTKTTFIEEKSSKIKHFNLNYEENRDYVFIGSSRTIYHVSTEIFKKNNLNIYNFGVSGNFLTDYPAYIVEAVKQKPKNIVISISKDILYSEAIPYPKKEVMINDLKFYYDFGNVELFFTGITQWLRSFHMFFNYSEVIYIKIKNLYNSFDFKKKHFSNTSLTKVVDMSLVDCTYFNMQMSDEKTIVKCKNGDGILLGTIEEKNILNDTEKGLKDTNKDVIDLLKKYVDFIKINKINPIIIIEPDFKHNVYVDNSEIYEDQFDSLVLNFSNLSTSVEMWADISHFNNYETTAQ